MQSVDMPLVESEDMRSFARAIREGLRLAGEPAPAEEGDTPRSGRTRRLNLDGEKVKNGLGQLVLTLVRLLHELLEKQAIRRIDAGSLPDEEIERIGVALMQQEQQIERLRKEFGLEEEDLNLDLGPLGRLL